MLAVGFSAVAPTYLLGVTDSTAGFYPARLGSTPRGGACPGSIDGDALGLYPSQQGSIPCRGLPGLRIRDNVRIRALEKWSSRRPHEPKILGSNPRGAIALAVWRKPPLPCRSGEIERLHLPWSSRGRTPPSHGGSRGSTPLRGAYEHKYRHPRCCTILAPVESIFLGITTTQ